LNSLSQNENNSQKEFKRLNIDENNSMTPSFSLRQVTYLTAVMGNLRRAFLLFIVTVVMAIVFTPAMLMSLGVIKMNSVLWNIYYISNAVNPIIYSFLNSNYRKRLVELFHRFLPK
jgi:hypothetical protein